MDRTMARIVVLLGGIAAALAGIASAAGILLRGDLATEEFITFRGEVVEMVTEGIYRYNSEGIVAEGVGWDIVTLLVVVPATFIALFLLWRGSLRAALVSAGLLAYFAYQSFEYAVFWAYGPLYPFYVAVLATSVSALALLVYGLDLEVVASHVNERFPRRAIAVYATFIVVILAGLWLPVIGGTLGGEVTDELEGASTLVVPAFDLGLLVPLSILTAVAVWKRLPVGYLLGMLVLVKGASMALAIASMLVVEWLVTGELLVPPLLIFALMALASVAIGARALQGIDEPSATIETREPATLPA
jgi:hypothetical protein